MPHIHCVSGWGAAQTRLHLHAAGGLGLAVVAGGFLFDVVVGDGGLGFLDAGAERAEAEAGAEHYREAVGHPGVGSAPDVAAGAVDAHLGVLVGAEGLHHLQVEGEAVVLEEGLLHAQKIEDAGVEHLAVAVD